MSKDKLLYVHSDNRLIGTLALTQDNKAAFEYDESWLKNGFSISPFSLPLEKRVFIPVKTHFNGLFGVFADSLPDAWGNILLNRLLKKNGMDPSNLNPLERLAIVGNSGMGALSYEPSEPLLSAHTDVDLDALAEECKKVLHSQYCNSLDELYRLGGTSGGARPKIMTNIDRKDWIIKFPAHVDNDNIGLMEYEYSLCAKECGISMPDTRLFPSKTCAGYFGVQRFDIENGHRKHMLTVAALLELNFEEPNLDYHALMKLTKILTSDNKEDLENMFRRMCFNVFAHNQDDHSKNFSFIYNEENDIWRLSPAYDLTYSTTYYGEHTTTINDNGQNPSASDLLQVGLKAGMKKELCLDIIENIQGKVEKSLGKYL